MGTFHVSRRQASKASRFEDVQFDDALELWQREHAQVDRVESRICVRTQLVQA